MAKLITPRSEDYSRWYTDVVLQSQLADYSPVRGCMVIRPLGMALWENMQKALDRMFKETGHENAYFPLFIPESFLHKEKEHVEGFAPECAVVTHGGGQKLEEPLVVRPTSETIIYSMYAKWIQSYRDLPVLINQWANVVRWEMRTRLFLRTMEFLWQEGHTAHATEAEAEEEAIKMMNVYDTFARDWMAMPCIKGIKTDAERFAGAVRTYCIEALMQDNKALQAGTSHNLGQNFAKAFEVTYQTQEGALEHVWNTSWGVSTRLIGALVMEHSDDAGLVLPPRLAPTQVVVVPIYKESERGPVLEAMDRIVRDLSAVVRVKGDPRDGVRPGFKFNEWELKGVPLRLELGPRDIAAGQVVAARRAARPGAAGKVTLPLASLTASIPPILDEIQKDLYDLASERLTQNTRPVSNYDEFKSVLEEHGGFLRAHWCGSAACEAQVKEETKATIRCVPLPGSEAAQSGACLVCGAASSVRVYFARAY
ncbi:MAG TPA: proline--tRNA ligase [Candidatus Polarisedimenticolia bacterium]|nr:proline--tRNA ligase [Candidatus Polarisedimenticolia bacterium]